MKKNNAMATATEVHFTKMHGLGNDFIVIDGTQKKPALSTSLIQHMADRHKGIGFDQLLIVCPPPRPIADFGYQIFNANGEPVQQCGNGARCLARYVHDRGLTQKSQIKIATQSRELTLKLHKDNQVTVDMGAPLFEPSQIPFMVKKQHTTYSLMVEGVGATELAAIGMGNPHAVLTVKDINKAPVNHTGKRISQHPCFPEHVNVGFMEIVNRKHIKLRVYERGVGETLACGSGACAAVVAGRQQDVLAPCVTVTLPGGDLEITWETPTSTVLMKGPASFVFEGIWKNDS